MLTMRSCSGDPSVLALRTTSSLVEGLGDTQNYAGYEDEAAAFAASLTDVLSAPSRRSSAGRDAFLAGGYAVAPADIAERVVAALGDDRDYGGEIMVKLHE